MHLVSFNGITLTTLGVTSPKFDDPSSGGNDRQVGITPRLSADPFQAGVMTGAQSLTAQITPATGQPVETTFLKVLAALALDDPNPKLLVAQLVDGVTNIETEATVGGWSYIGVNTMAVTFVINTPGFRAQADTTMKSLAATSADGNFANGNTGYRDMYPVITSYWPGTTNRPSAVATLGWKNRISTTITNTGTEPLINQPYQIGPINTNDLVLSSLMKSNGDDLRVFCEGKELRRNLIGANKEASFLWVILPTIAPGQAVILDIVFGNNAATSPPTLTQTSVPPIPGMDISGDGRTATSSTTTTFTSTGAGWDVNAWAGGTVMTAWGTDKQIRRVTSNTATQLTVTRAFPVAPTGDFVVIKSGMLGDGGIASAGAATSVTDSSQGWRINEWIGAIAEIISGTGVGSKGTVTSNTATVLTVSSWSGTAPAASSQFRVFRLNGARMWDVRPPPKVTNYPGLWQANKIQAPPTQVNFDAPGSWYRFTYQPSRDEYSQPRYDTFVVGAGDNDHVPIMNIQRARDGRVGTMKEAGIADAIGVATPFPILGAYFGYTIRNAKKAGSGTPGEGMAEARFMTQEAGGELWSAFLSDVAVNNSTATVSPAWYDLTGSGSPNRLAMALIPNGSDDIPNSDNNTAQLRSNGAIVLLGVNPTGVITESRDWLSIAFPSTVSTPVYDVNLIVRTGGASSTKPYHQIVIGGTDHRIFVAGTDERIVVDCNRKLVSLQTAAGALVRRVPYAVQAQEIVADADGTTRTLVAARWLPIPSSTVDTNAIYYSDPSGAGWGTIQLGVVGRKGYRT